MAEETKKISFSFSKLKKPNNVLKKVEVAGTQVEYVDSFDGVRGKFSYKGNVRSDVPEKKELVIPLLGTKTVLEVIREKLNQNSADKCDATDKKVDDNQVENYNNNICSSAKNVETEKKHIEDNKVLSIDDLAAKEILNDLEKDNSKEKAANTLVIKQTLKGVEEKEIPIDYENIPVNDFGLAMLRGMGWTPETGIGREQRIVSVVAPKLRPKGLGLGADKMLLKQAAKDPDLAISLKSYVKLINGPYKGSYGQVEAMDDNNSRVIVKLTFGSTISVSEMLLVPVTKNDYEKNSKVQNSSRYEKYKELPADEESKLRISEGRKKSHENNSHRKEKYNRKAGEDQTGSGKERHSSSLEREHESRRRHERDSLRDGRHLKGKKKKEKKKKKKKSKGREQHSSEYDTDSSADRKYRHKSSKSHKHKLRKTSH